MSAVTGPISTLPGSHHPSPDGVDCDSCGFPAKHRIQGETDSMGSEMTDLCDGCFEATKKIYKEEPLIGTCYHCSSQQVETFPWRDYEEGTCGRVYHICSRCLKATRDRYLDDPEVYLSLVREDDESNLREMQAEFSTDDDFDDE